MGHGRDVMFLVRDRFYRIRSVFSKTINWNHETIVVSDAMMDLYVSIQFRHVFRSFQAEYYGKTLPEYDQSRRGGKIGLWAASNRVI